MIAAVGILLLGVSTLQFIGMYKGLVIQVQEVLKGALQEMAKKSPEGVPDFLPDWLKDE